MITVSGLTKRYGDRTVVDDVSFAVEPGTVTGFLGPNGAGKTTTMRMITGLVTQSAGTATVDGRPYAARVDEVLDMVGLGPAGRRRIRGYSLGMRQRLGIAGALLADPPVLMFDEPANGLDPEGIRWMRGLLRGHAARGGTVLLSSHLLAEVEHTVDRLVVIGGGRVVADGPIGTLLAGDGVRVRALDPAGLADALTAAGFPVTADGPVLSVAGATAEQVGTVAARGGHVLTDLRPADRGLEDLFFQLTA